MADTVHQTRRRWLGAIGITALTVGLVAGIPAPAQAVTTHHSVSAATPAVVPPPAGGSYAALTPARILDTRSGLGGHGTVGPLRVIDLQVEGRGGVPPAGVSAVVIQVTATQQTSSGYVTVYPSFVARPLASDLDFVAGVNTSNLVTVPVGSNGRVELFNGSGGTTQLIADVQGYFRSGAAASPGAFRSLTPARILDTRTGVGAVGKISPSGTVDLQVTGRGGVPATGVSAVAMNVTVAAPTQPGFVTVYPAGVARPNVSNLNFYAGQVVPNLVIIPVGPGGKIELWNGSSGRSHLIADVQGYFLAGTASTTGVFKTLTPSRILDTRTGFGGSHRARAFTETKVHVDGFGGVPATGVSAVVLNVTGAAPSAMGSLVAYPTGVAMPIASNLNFYPGRNRANLVVVPVDAFGWISLGNNSTGSLDEVADVAGYFLGTGAAPTVLGPDSYGPFIMGMTIAAAKVAYPALNPTFFNSTSCGVASLPQAILTFNHGSTALSFVSPRSAVQTLNGIRYGDTLGSVVGRFPWADILPDEPQLIMTVTKAEQRAPNPTSYWIYSNGPRDPVTDVPAATDKISGISLDQNEHCFD